MRRRKRKPAPGGVRQAIDEARRQWTPEEARRALVAIGAVVALRNGVRS